MSPPASAAALWRALAPLVEREARLADWAALRPATAFIYEFIRFGVKMAWACLFGALMLALLLATHLLYPAGSPLPRYDFLVLAALAIQGLLLAARMETIDEAKVILAFHLVGTAMEVFKTGTGSWIYPETSFLRIGGVPLFTGFMYASVGSFIARAWRLFDFRFSRHPPLWLALGLALAIYAHFFLDHWGVDLRLGLLAAALAIFGRSWIQYRVWRRPRRMPLLLADFLTAAFVWLAENLGTFARAWRYPNQADGWHFVGLSKFSSWFLLLIISYALVALVNRPEPPEAEAAEAPERGAGELKLDMTLRPHED